MKRYLKIVIAALSGLALFGCTPNDDARLQDRITDLKIIVTATQTPNVFQIQASRRDIIGFWDLGNGTTASGVNEVTAQYPFAGTYTVTLTAYSNGGKANNVSMVLPVLDNNFALLSDPIYGLLAGEVGSRTGKTWVVDSLLYGHLTNLNLTTPDGMPNNSAVPVNASSFPNYRSGELRLGRTLYDDRATFILSAEDGQAFKYTNNGSSLVTNTGSNGFKDQVFMKAASWSPTVAVACNTLPLPPGFTGAYNSDWQVNCTPPDKMPWQVRQNAGRWEIHFPNVADGYGGFLHFALGWTDPYIILSINENRMVVQITTYSGATLTTKSMRRLVLIKAGTPSGLPPQTPEETPYIFKL